MKLRFPKFNKEAYKNAWAKVTKNFSTYVNVNTMSLLIAILASYLSYRALNESIKQRESMYKPEIFIGAADFWVDYSDMNDIKVYSDTLSRRGVLRPWYRLDNVGMGSALRVHAHMRFNAETLMAYFSNCGLLDVQLKKSEDIVDTLIFHQDTMTVFNSGYISDWTVDYVLPASQSEEKSIQYFPPIVFDSLLEAFLWVNQSSEQVDREGFRIPIILNYKDINDKWYTKEFVISVFFYALDNNMVYCSIKANLSWDDFIKENGEAMDLLYFREK